jgi:hypothetical protein
MQSLPASREDGGDWSADCSGGGCHALGGGGGAGGGRALAAVRRGGSGDWSADCYEQQLSKEELEFQIHKLVRRNTSPPGGGCHTAVFPHAPPPALCAPPSPHRLAPAQPQPHQPLWEGGGMSRYAPDGVSLAHVRSRTPSPHSSSSSSRRRRSSSSSSSSRGHSQADAWGGGGGGHALGLGGGLRALAADAWGEGGAVTEKQARSLLRRMLTYAEYADVC